MNKLNIPQNSSPNYTSKDFLLTRRPTLYSHNLNASIQEYVGLAGFTIVQHIPHLAALVQLGSLRLQLLRRYPQYEVIANSIRSSAPASTSRAAVDDIFELHKVLSVKAHHMLSGSPMLNSLGQWQLDVTDQQGNRLFLLEPTVATVRDISAALPFSDLVDSPLVTGRTSCAFDKNLKK
jgi:hypothetical protein